MLFIRVIEQDIFWRAYLRPVRQWFFRTSSTQRGNGIFARKVLAVAVAIKIFSVYIERKKRLKFVQSTKSTQFSTTGKYLSREIRHLG